MYVCIDEDVNYGYQHQRDVIDDCHNGREVVLVGRGVWKSFVRKEGTNPSSRIINKFQGQEIWGVDSHRDDPSGENEERAQL